MSIADKYTTLTTEKIPNVYEAGEEAGKKAEWNRFWDNFQDYGNRTDYSYGLGGIGWTDEIFPPKHKIKVTDTARMFQNCNLKTIPSIQCHYNCTTLTQTYYYARNTVTIGTVKLHSSIEEDGTVKTKDGSNITFNQTFNSCNALENITFEGVIGNEVSFVSSKNLTSESIDNIIEHLKDLKGETRQTLTLHSSVLANLTAKQIEDMNKKNWIGG